MIFDSINHTIPKAKNFAKPAFLSKKIANEKCFQQNLKNSDKLSPITDNNLPNPSHLGKALRLLYIRVSSLSSSTYIVPVIVLTVAWNLTRFNELKTCYTTVSNL